jgi:folate-dependent tRNA-U54 methylase TrmFO/GidA
MQFPRVAICFAGRITGIGYRHAASGLVAGLNAARFFVGGG